MLVPDNIHPEQTIYYNGAFVLQALQHHRQLDLLELFQHTRETIAMSLPVFMLCVDWLYLLGLAEINSSGQVVLCS
jgi:hypothetical protein